MELFFGAPPLEREALGAAGPLPTRWPLFLAGQPLPRMTKRVALVLLTPALIASVAVSLVLMIPCGMAEPGQPRSAWEASAWTSAAFTTAGCRLGRWRLHKGSAG